MDFTKMRNILFFSVLATVTIVFAFLIKPFFYPIFWAAVIASLFNPVYKKFVLKLKNKNISSLLALTLVIVIIIIPLILIGSLIINEAINLLQAILDNKSGFNETLQNFMKWLETNPLTQKLGVAPDSVRQKVVEVIGMISSYLFTAVKNFTQNSLAFVVMFVIMAYTLFFFLRDGEKFLKKIMYLSPIGDKQEVALYKKFISTSRATLKGTVIVAAIQGALGATLFSLLNIEGALIWGVVMMFFSIIPGLGSFVVWLPVAIIMFILGYVWQAIVIVLVGFLLISTIDNILRPILVGKDTQMHPLLILFSTLGGVVLFGVTGFILGPIITALLISLWDMYEEYYKDGLGNNK